MITSSTKRESSPCQQAGYSDCVEDVLRSGELRLPQVRFLVHEQTSGTRRQDKTGNL